MEGIFFIKGIERVEGLLKENEGREGVLGKTAIFFFLTMDRTEEGAGGWGGMGRRPSGRDGGREVGENGEEAEGVRFPYSPRAEAVCEGLSTAAGGGGQRREAGERARGGEGGCGGRGLRGDPIYRPGGALERGAPVAELGGH